MDIYCPSLTNYQRLKTRAVMVGNVGIGGNNPIRVQSMTTTDTMDTDCLLYTSPSPRDISGSRMPSSA